MSLQMSIEADEDTDALRTIFKESSSTSGREIWVWGTEEDADRAKEIINQLYQQSQDGNLPEPS